MMFLSNKHCSLLAILVLMFCEKFAVRGSYLFSDGDGVVRHLTSSSYEYQQPIRFTSNEQNKFKNRKPKPTLADQFDASSTIASHPGRPISSREQFFTHVFSDGYGYEDMMERSEGKIRKAKKTKPFSKSIDIPSVTKSFKQQSEKKTLQSAAEYNSPYNSPDKQERQDKLAGKKKKKTAAHRRSKKPSPQSCFSQNNNEIFPYED